MAKRRETVLARELKERIRGGARITFADYMREAVSRGYYGKGPDIGAGGDFYTAVSLPGFAEALSRWVRAALERLGAGAAPLVVEIGGGTGELAAALTGRLDALGWKGRYEYVLVEPSPALAKRQRERTGLRGVADLAELEGFAGVVLANEVLDALPVHRVTRLESGALAELYLSLEGDEIREAPGPLSTPALATAAQGLEPGNVQEVSLLLGPFLRALHKALDRGYVLLLDYGDEANVTRDSRPGGTVRTYEAHAVGSDPFEAPGEQDVTADVDFTALSEAAASAGFDLAGFATQGAFLLDLGIAEDYHALAGSDPVQALKMKTLFLPGGMGERFKALALAKDAPREPSLPGFGGRGVGI